MIPRALRTPAAIAAIASVLAAAVLDRSVAAETQAPSSAPCPPGVAPGTRCLTGRDVEGAHYWLAVPPRWNGVLVVHAHGGPELGTARASRAAEDLQRWSIWSRAGFAYAGSAYRQTGVAVTAAAEDVERVRRLFVAAVGVPQRTILHGQSWGAGVAARAAQRDAAANAARPAYDGVLLTSGVLGGGSKSYDFRLDLRVVYQAVCANHPRGDEPTYPLWQGLPPASTLTRAQLAGRVDECTGVRRRPDERSSAEQGRLDTITRIVRIPERSLIGHLDWATWGFQDIVFKRLGGRNPFSNDGVHYRGSADDEALNAKVARYRADPSAATDFAADADLLGPIAVPVLTLHAIDDPTAFVELESTFRDAMARVGSAERLVQVFSDEHEHSYLADAEYVAAIGALLAWVESGAKPTAQDIARRCAAVDPAFSPATGCRLQPDYRPAPLGARVPAR